MWRSGFLCSQTPRSRATSNSNSRYLHIQQSTHFPYCISLAASKFSRSITNSDSAVLRLVYASKVRPGANLPLFAFQKNYVIAALPFVTRSLTLSFEANGTNSDREKGYVHPIGERPGCYLSIVDMKCMHPSRKQVPLYPWRWYRIRYMCKSSDNKRTSEVSRDTSRTIPDPAMSVPRPLRPPRRGQLTEGTD